MKYLIVILVAAVGLYLLFGRKPRSGSQAVPRKPTAAQEPVRMLACTHCGVHLPHDDALFDSSGRGFCSEAHLRAGGR